MRVSVRKAAVLAAALALAAVVVVGCDGGNNNPGNQGGGGGSQFNPNINYGSLTDTRDGKTYRTVVIGSQTWMAENLNYNASGSACYNNAPDSCAKYGRLYNWATVMDGASSSESSPSGVQGVCPVGWHVPSDAEWETLVKYVDPNASGNYDNNAGTKLRSKSGWNNNGNGTDDYGFSALPGGGGYGGVFGSAGDYGNWLCATENAASLAWYRYMSYYYDDVGRDSYGKTFLFSLRCLRDSAAPQ